MKVPPAKIVFSDADKQEILKSIEESLTTGQLTLGKHGKEFEAEFAQTCGTKYAVSVSSGTSALEIALRCKGMEGKEVIIPTNTFFATAESVLHAGATVKLADIDPKSMTLSVESLEKVVSDQTAAVVVVHIAGTISSEINDIVDFCQKRNILLFEDAAHAHGSSFNGQKAGSFGVAGSFSFYPTKVLTSGEGGMLVTNDEQIAEDAKKYRDQGKQSFLENKHDRLGNNWRMSEVHAVIGKVHHRHLSDFIEERNQVAQKYDQALKGIEGVTPLTPSDRCISNYYKYIALLDKGLDRKSLKKTLREKYEVGLSGEVYELPLHLQPFFNQQYNKGDFPVAEDFCERHICLPLFQGMTEEQVKLVIKALSSELSAVTA